MKDSDLPIKRREAEKLGLQYYFTNKPCKHGHLSRRLTKSYACCQCAKEGRAAKPFTWGGKEMTYENFPEFYKEQQRKNNQTPKRKAYMREYMREYYKTQKHKDWRNKHDRLKRKQKREQKALEENNCE